MSTATALAQLDGRIVRCRKCPRLIEHCRKTATEKRASFSDWTYHGKPVPNFGDHSARLLVVGLAPAGHGANRTGRMFTGDRSGDFLYARLHETGFANQAEATDRDDGLELRDCLITAAVHCAPPANKPTMQEQNTCRCWLEQTFDLLADLRVIVTLGKLGHDAVLKLYKQRGWIDALSGYPFGHAAEHRIDGRPTLLCSFHPSQQNTFTGRLTPKMMGHVFARARQVIDE